MLPNLLKANLLHIALQQIIALFRHDFKPTARKPMLEVDTNEIGHIKDIELTLQSLQLGKYSLQQLPAHCVAEIIAPQHGDGLHAVQPINGVD